MRNGARCAFRGHSSTCLLPGLLAARCRCQSRKRREQSAQIRGSERIIDVLSSCADLLQCQYDWKIGLAFVGTPETFYLMHGFDAPPMCCVKGTELWHSNSTCSAWLPRIWRSHWNSIDGSDLPSPKEAKGSRTSRSR